MVEKKSDANILPFKPYIYNIGFVGIENVVCPPYDIIGSSLQDELYKRSDYNVVRLEFGKDFEGDDDKNNKYTRARDFFTDWMKRGILRQAGRDSIYIYNQKFEIDGVSYERTGFIALFVLPSEETGDKSIFGHEATLSKPKEDRFKLMEAANANFSPIFSVFEDINHNVFNLLNDAVKNDNAVKIFDFKDENGIENLLYGITETAMINSLQNEMKKKTVYIADGHHRFETCMNFRDYVVKNGLKDINADCCMMYFAPAGQAGLVILPTHRCIVNKGINIDEFINNIKPDFEIKNVNITDLGEETKKAGYGAVSFGFAHKSGKAFVLSFKNSDKNKKDQNMEATFENPLNNLDVKILESYILKKTLKISQDDINNQTYLKYEKDTAKAMEKLNHGSVEAVFFMNPTKIEDVINIASQNLRMPQKSTFFYPKIITGLAINSLKK